MLNNKQVFDLIAKKEKVRDEYDKELESYTKSFRNFPSDDEIVRHLANSAFSTVMKEPIDASINEVYNYFSIIDRNKY